MPVRPKSDTIRRGDLAPMEEDSPGKDALREELKDNAMELKEFSSTRSHQP